MSPLLPHPKINASNFLTKSLMRPEREREREVSDTHISWLETKSTSVFVLVLFEDVPKQDAFRIITSLAVNTPRGHVVC